MAERLLDGPSDRNQSLSPVPWLQRSRRSSFRHWQSHFPQVFGCQSKVDRGAFWITMPQCSTNGVQAHSLLEEMNCQRMTEHMASHRWHVQATQDPVPFQDVMH